MDVSNHYISKFLKVESTPLLNPNPTLVCFGGGLNDINNINYSDKKIVPILQKFINSNQESFNITTNLFYDAKQVTQDIKDNINSFFTFKQKYYDMQKDLFKLDKYMVLHIRCTDNYFDKDFNSDKLILEIIKLQLPPNTIIISNNLSIKIKLNKLFGFYYINSNPIHSGNVNNINYNSLESTIIDYIILSKSLYTYCISFYHHGSGFSEQCSILYNIPYKLIYLESESLITLNKISTPEDIIDYNILMNYYNYRLEWPNNLLEINNIKYDYSKTAFITLTNSGYINYTLNCLKSLEKINTKINLQCYCIGVDGYNNLKNNGYECNLIDDEINSTFQTFRKDNWSNITYYKFEIIYENLLNYEYVCITDGDIVYENNCFIDFLLQNIEKNDMLIQSEGLEHQDLCSGFMFIKSNETTRLIFDPKNVEKYKNILKWDDQVYINNIRHKLKYKRLPLSLFPTGKYYYNYSNNIKPYLIHFNWIEGHEKKQRMIKYNKWYIKIKICQHGTDGFGHQLEGMLRLLSLSINNKADYQYNYKKIFQFEHTNFKLEKLSNYILTALKYLSNGQEESTFLYTSIREQRTFNEILINDVNYNDTIYLYDGVSTNIEEELPPNFEQIKELEKSLPLLRKAFVEKNKYLPKQSYNKKLINVCCHIRLGDAIGQRILDNDKLCKVIKYYQNDLNYQIIIHTDGDMSSMKSNNTIIYDSKVDILQVFSDFIHADILIINYSSLSIAAHLLGDENQKVICPTNAGNTFKYRILDKCVTCDKFLQNNI